MPLSSSRWPGTRIPPLRSYSGHKSIYASLKSVLPVMENHPVLHPYCVIGEVDTVRYPAHRDELARQPEGQAETHSGNNRDDETRLPKPTGALALGDY